MPQAVAIPLAFAVGAGTVGATIYQGEKSAKAQRRALRSQQEANRLATSRAAAEQRKQDMEQRRLNRRRPDMVGILNDERGVGTTGGPASTLLTSAASRRPTLGRPAVLGA